MASSRAADSLSLSPIHLAHLLDLLEPPEAVASSTMDSLVTKFSSVFSAQGPSEAFKMGLSIVHMLDHGDILQTNAQRLVALAFLHEIRGPTPARKRTIRKMGISNSL